MEFSNRAYRGNRDLRYCKIMGFELSVWGGVFGVKGLADSLSAYRLITSILLSAGYIVEGLTLLWNTLKELDKFRGRGLLYLLII